MPDISLFEPLCDELNITINELLKGQRLDNKKNQSKMQVESLIDYSKYINWNVSKIVSNISSEYLRESLRYYLNQNGNVSKKEGGNKLWKRDYSHSHLSQLWQFQC